MKTFFRSVGAATLLLLLCHSSAPPCRAADREINVAAAADLSVALQEVAANYEKQSGVKVKLSFAASGALTQQIQNGAPFDLFFSADMDYPRQLISAGLAESESLYRYAVGRLVLWVPKDSPLDVERKGIEVLLDPSVRKDCDCKSAACSLWPGGICDTATLWLKRKAPRQVGGR